jgi:hypothetical protein
MLACCCCCCCCRRIDIKLYPRSMLAMAVNYFCSGQNMCRALRWAGLGVLGSMSCATCGCAQHIEAGWHMQHLCTAHKYGYAPCSDNRVC